MWWAVADNRDPWGSLWPTASKQGLQELGGHICPPPPCDALSSLATPCGHSLRWARDSVDIAAPHLNSHSDGSVTLNSSVFAITKCLNSSHESRAHIPQSVHICIQDSPTAIRLTWPLPYQSIIYQENVSQVNLVGAFFSIEFFCSQMTLTCVKLT